MVFALLFLTLLQVQTSQALYSYYYYYYDGTDLSYTRTGSATWIVYPHDCKSWCPAWASGSATCLTPRHSLVVYPPVFAVEVTVTKYGLCNQLWQHIVWRWYNSNGAVIQEWRWDNTWGNLGSYIVPSGAKSMDVYVTFSYANTLYATEGGVDYIKVKTTCIP